MKYFNILLFFTISIFCVSCESERLQVFSVDQCVGEYVCKIDGQTFMVLPGGRIDVPSPPLSNYPKEGTVVTVTKTDEYELTLTFEDRILVAHVDETGQLTIPDTTIYMENDHFTMTLNAEYPKAYVAHNQLFIKQEAKGTALCNDKGDIFTLTVSNIQYCDGKR